MDHIKELIKILDSFKPETINGAVIIHLDKETKQLKSISPLLQVSSIDELYVQLADTRDAITNFLEDLVKKKLKDNGQEN